ncbi:MAG: hypothetical protein LBC97_10610 [Bifidobacteriaceae bacterium]|jgi:hypothetical protein|nr:hypothetical protein [Bifidobacteriaceae bacterium]
MCYFITATISGAGAAELNDVLRGAGSGVRFEPALNPHVQAQLDAGESYLAHKASGCDCDTWLGAATRHRPTADRVGRLRARGWSEARIERWLLETEGAAARLAARQASPHHGDPATGEPWIAVIGAALSHPRVTSFGLLLHFYSGSIDAESFQFERVDRPLAALTPDVLAAMPEDTLLSFSRGRSGAHRGFR